MKTILIKELRYFFNSVSSYLIMGIFLLITSFSVWIFPHPAPNILNAGLANLSVFFEFIPWLILLLSPIITMGIVADEKKSKTIELLMTKPISESEIILGKFFACLIFIIITFFPIDDLSITKIDYGQIITGYFGLILISCSFISIGLFFSSITRKQLVAFVLSFITILFFLEGITIIQKMEILEVFQLFNLTERAEGFYKGILDLKDVIFFISITIAFLLLSTETLKRRK